MYELTKVSGPPEPYCRADELKVGELAESAGGSWQKPDTIILKVFGGCVSLTCPGDTWLGPCGLLVRRLPPGTVIQLKVRDND